MGIKLTKFSVKTKENEQIDAIVKVTEERRSVIHGTVIGLDDKPVKDAVVKLLILKDPCNPYSLCPVSHTFTDDCGQFLFGPLCPDQEYIIKVWYNAVNFADLVVRPIPCNEPCLDGKNTCKHKRTDCEREEE